MRYNNLLTLFFCLLFSLCILVYPSPSSKGVIEGLNLCYNVIIPSLFPFTVVSLMLFEGNYISYLSQYLDKFTNKVFRLSGKNFCIYLVSLLGGYPVGAKLIEKSFLRGEINKSNAELMLTYSVNSGPSFIIIAVGVQILESKLIGFLLFCSNLAASLILAIIFGRFMSSQKAEFENKKDSQRFSDLFVKSTYDACYAMVSICSFVLVFSSVTKIISSFFGTDKITKMICMLLEVTKGATLADGNILIISFLLGFSGICVHFQILSMCRSIKPRYYLFLIARIIHGILSSFISFILLKIFGLSVTTGALATTISYQFSKYSVYFGLLFIFSSVVFMSSVKKSINFK